MRSPSCPRAVHRGACRLLAALLLSGATLPTPAADASLQPFGERAGSPALPWRVVGLPDQAKPFTRFNVVDLEGRRAVRIEAIASYGNLVHPLRTAGGATRLAWHWRVEQPIEAADLRTRAGDDTAVKVCVFFDLPIEKVPFGERQLLRLARWRSGEPLPGATVCYVWDAHLPAGTALDNPYTRRMRYLVVRSGAERLHRWVAEQRDIAADFARLFGAESTEVPPVIGVAVGADTDNTGSRSVSYVSGLELLP